MTTTLFLPCIAGPTGAGKTAAALALAAALPLAVVNADSRQVYKDFPIITAQPSPEERSRCPHLLYGFLNSEATLGAGEYARMAANAVASQRALGRVPVLVGGTGLYFRALLEGLAPIPAVPAEITGRWQERCCREGGPALHTLLVEKDPVYAAKIHPNDRQRIIRALEVLESTGKPFSWWHGRTPSQKAYQTCKVGIGLHLKELEPLLERRISLMLEAGALEEAEAALAHCPDPGAPGWSGIGCSEMYRYITGALTMSECRTLWLKNTRAYAKRQLTWFRADPGIRWFRPDETAAIVDYVSAAAKKTGG